MCRHDIQVKFQSRWFILGSFLPYLVNGLYPCFIGREVRPMNKNARNEQWLMQADSISIQNNPNDALAVLSEKIDMLGRLVLSLAQRPQPRDLAAA